MFFKCKRKWHALSPLETKRKVAKYSSIDTKISLLFSGVQRLKRQIKWVHSKVK